MANLIPAFTDDHTPPGEKDVYNLLAGGPDDWTVLHSLDLAPWNSSRRTEVDFVVIMPQDGILCLEVKSHDKIDFDGKQWFPSSIRRSPFKQAMDARFSFRRRIEEQMDFAKTIPVLHCCIFPNALFDVETCVSIHPWELIDRRIFRKFISSAEFCADLRTRLRRARQAERIPELAQVISQQRVNAIVQLCYPVQKRRPGAAEEIRQRQAESERILRDQQRPVLKLADSNERIVVTGGAGTGKTLIAMEIAKRAAEKGRRVALLCFNRLVGDWMARNVAASTPLPNLVVDNVPRLLTRMAAIPIPEAPTDEFWARDVPELIEERLTDPDFTASAAFEYVIVDEAQDLLARPVLWQCVTSLLEGGVETGRFALFGDLDHQVLAQKNMVQRVLDQLCGNASFSRWHLSENCRNYRAIGSAALALSGLPENVYTEYLRRGGSHNDIAYIKYSNDERQLEALGAVIRDMRNRGYRNSEITILSFGAVEKSVAWQLAGQGFKIGPAGTSNNVIGLASVHAFKGMENKVIVVTDLELNMGGLSRALFYTALTRSTGLVRVLARETAVPRLLEWAAGVR